MSLHFEFFYLEVQVVKEVWIPQKETVKKRISREKRLSQKEEKKVKTKKNTSLVGYWKKKSLVIKITQLKTIIIFQPVKIQNSLKTIR